ncbi:MAG: hypothetical protein S0880_10985 [Actinomycetota bacterium]|nr:hypothetical protein [Actinomycetota bacterium]
MTNTAGPDVARVGLVAGTVGIAAAGALVVHRRRRRPHLVLVHDADAHRWSPPAANG